MKVWGFIAAIGVWVATAGVVSADDTAAKTKQIWPQDILEKYDKDADGHLNKEELAVMQAHILSGRYTPPTLRYLEGAPARRQLDARRKIVLARYDANGDGKLSEAELAIIIRDVNSGVDPAGTEKVLAAPMPKKK